MKNTKQDKRLTSKIVLKQINEEKLEAEKALDDRQVEHVKRMIRWEKRRGL